MSIKYTHYCNNNFFNDLRKYVITDRNYIDSKKLSKQVYKILRLNTDNFLKKYEYELLYALNGFRLYNIDKNNIAYYKMLIVNKLINLYGIEFLKDRYYYINAGDTYNTTILYNIKKDKFFVSSWGSVVEANYKYFKDE